MSKIEKKKKKKKKNSKFGKLGEIVRSPEKSALTIARLKLNINMRTVEQSGLISDIGSSRLIVKKK